MDYDIVISGHLSGVLIGFVMTLLVRDRLAPTLNSQRLTSKD
jgi:gas vesicle protein